MHIGNLVFAQLMEFAPWHTFRRLVGKYRGDFNVRTFSCLDQFLYGLRTADLPRKPARHRGVSARTTHQALSHGSSRHGEPKRTGRCQRVARLAHLCRVRPCPDPYRSAPLCKDSLSVDLAETVYALDATTIDLCLSLFPWAKFRTTKAAVKLCTHYSICAEPVDRSTGLLCDQEVQLVVFYSQQAYPERLRRIRYRDTEGRRLVFLTNHMTLAPLTICELYRSRWQVELFFKWIKQHLRIKRFFGTSENAVKTQVWIAVAVYVLVAIVRKRLNLELSLHEMLQILSITPFDKTPMIQLLTYSATSENGYHDPNQLILL